MHPANLAVRLEAVPEWDTGDDVGLHFIVGNTLGVFSCAALAASLAPDVEPRPEIVDFSHLITVAERFDSVCGGDSDDTVAAAERSSQCRMVEFLRLHADPSPVVTSVLREESDGIAALLAERLPAYCGIILRRLIASRS